MNRDRPEWVRCVGFGDAKITDEKKTWCGRPEEPFFIDPLHAALTGRNEGRIVACRECVEAICRALWNGHDDPEYLQQEKGE
jgi:hypothetical protein